MTVLSVPSFGAGVVKEGSADAQRTDELQACDSLDIGPRGQLVATSTLTTFARALSAVATELSPIFGMAVAAHPKNPILFFIGSNGATAVYAALLPDGSTATGGAFPGAAVAPVSGIISTFASFPYVNAAGNQVRVLLVTAASRSFLYPNSGYGTYVILYDAGPPSYSFLALDKYDSLGTGAQGEFLGGTRARQLAFRGVVAYNNHAFGWGVDSRDPGGDGPNRLMFSNLGNPLKWGLDPQEQAILDGDPETDRAFEDSDAIELGGSGEAIRCCYPYRGKLWVGTNKELHYVEGFGRESFKTNGDIKIAGSRNVIGPYAMIEGPDDLLYGVSTRGLWRLNGSAVQHPGDRLIDFNEKSNGYWDLIWTDASRTQLAYPGRTNQDLVWMLVVANQVWVVIPFCNAALGYGYGIDTVIVKFHTLTGGFTRQVFASKTLTCGAELEREGVSPGAIYVCDSAHDDNVLRYAYRATQVASAALPTLLPDVTMGEYAPFGPNGVGVFRRKYLTLAWETGALPLVFVVTLTVDGQAVESVTLTVGPVAPNAPVNGDIWVDTSGTDTNLGNGTAGTSIPSNVADYVMKVWVTTWNKWSFIVGGGQQGTRVTVPINFLQERGSRFTVRFRCTLATGRFQIENLSDKPAIIREAQ